jgi:hypothetical protein
MCLELRDWRPTHRVWINMMSSVTGFCRQVLPREDVNTSGKAGAQIPHLPLGEMIHPPGGDNPVCM